MRADDLDGLLARAATGEAEALALLIAGTRGDLLVLIANHAVSTAMVEQVLTAAWEEAYPRLPTAPPGRFVPWFWDIARDLLARVLGERDRAATDQKDPLAHAITRAGLDGLAAGLADEVAGLADLKRGIERLEPAMQQLVRRRYADRLRIEVLAAELGQPQAAIAATLFRARAAARGQLEAAEQLIAMDPLFAALVEEYVTDTLIPDARQLLSGSVIKDLQYCAAFEAQVRADLILTAMFAPPALDAARELAQGLVTPLRTSQRMRAQRGSDRQGRISDRANRVSDRVPAQGTGRISDPRRRAASGPQVAAASGTGSFRRHHDAPPEAPDRGGGPWTIIGVAAVVLAVVIGAFALSPGGDEPRPRRRPDPIAANPPSSTTAPRTAPTPVAPRPADPPAVVVPRTAPTPVAPTPVAPPGPVAPAAVAPPGPVAPPAVDGPPTLALAPPAALMVGTASDLVAAASGVALAKVEFLADGAPVGTSLQAPYAVSWTPARAGGVRLQARATDAAGRVGMSDIVLATVAAAPATPLTVRLAQPANGAAFTAPASIPLAARIEGGLVERVEFLHGEAKLAEKLAPPFEATWNRVPAGSYEIRARAWGRDGSVTSDPVTVVVAVPATQPPSVRIESPGEFETIAENAKAMIRVRAVDKDGVIARVEFSVDGQKIGDDTTLPYSWVWPKPAWGEHVVSATAFDDRGSRGDAEPVAVLVGPKTITRYVRGVSMGDAAELDGYRLLALSDAIADGFNVGNGKVVAPAKAPIGDLDLGQRALFAHALVGDEEQLRFSQVLPDGFYSLYAWVADTGDQLPFDLELEGVKVGALGKVAKGGWGRFGPFNVRVADGCLNALASKRSGAPRIAGIAIYGVMVDQPPAAAGMWCEWWHNLGGTDLGSLTASSRYPCAPTGGGGSGDGGLGNLPVDVGVRATAWLVPPVTGVYRLQVRGDDQVEAALSADEAPARAARVAFCPTNTDKWDDKPEQQSADIPLVAGHRYFLRVLLKGGGGGNWFNVGWRLPDGTLERPIPGSRLIMVPPSGMPGLVAAATAAAARRPAAARGPGAADAAVRETVANDGDLAPGTCQLAYDGAWSSDATRADAYRGDEHYASAADAVATVAFTGTRLQWYASKAPNMGIAAVSFDGGPETQVDQYAASRQWNVLQYASPTLAPGRHVCRIRVTPQRNPASNGTWITIDRMVVTAPAAAAEAEREQAILVEYFDQVPPMRVGDAVGQGVFERRPYEARAGAAFATSPERGDRYAARIRGDFRPPVAGAYRFTLDCDDHAELWLAPADEPAARQKLVMTSYEEKRSDPVALDPAKTYRLEALMTENDLGDRCRAGWLLPDGTSESPIPAGRFLGPAAPLHGLKREVWRGIGGANLQDLVAALGRPPNHVDWILGAKTLCDGIEYGERLSGWLAPTVSGEYKLIMEHDDGARFSISNDDQAAGLQSRLDRTYVADFNSGTSGPAHLEAGRRYRIEVLHKQGGGDAFIGLGWLKPDGTREPIPRECLVPLP